MGKMRNISHSKCQYSAQQDFYLVVMLCIYTTMYLLLLILCKCGKSKIRYLFFLLSFFKEREEEEDFFSECSFFFIWIYRAEKELFFSAKK